MAGSDNVEAIGLSTGAPEIGAALAAEYRRALWLSAAIKADSNVTGTIKADSNVTGTIKADSNVTGTIKADSNITGRIRA
jgi:hypothetical protein